MVNLLLVGPGVCKMCFLRKGDITIYHNICWAGSISISMISSGFIRLPSQSIHYLSKQHHKMAFCYQPSCLPNMPKRISGLRISQTHSEFPLATKRWYLSSRFVGSTTPSGSEVHIGVTWCLVPQASPAPWPKCQDR